MSSRAVRSVAFAACVSVALPGCLASSMTAGESLREALDHYTDAVRWGRAASAMTHVAPRLRRAMARRHLAWARNIRIAETQVVDLNHNDAQHRAVVFVQIAWYSDSDPMVRQTTLEQTWRDLDGWVLVEETVADGDEALLAFGVPPRSDDPRRSDSEESGSVEDDAAPSSAADAQARGSSAVRAPIAASERSTTRRSRSLSRHRDDTEAAADDEGWQ